MSEESVKDMLFFDLNEAVRTAQRGNRVQLTTAVTGLQVCYYMSKEPVPGGPPNLVHVPVHDAHRFFSTSTLRLPSEIFFPADLGQTSRQKLADEVTDILQKARLQRNKSATRAVERAKRSQPVFEESEPLRIWLPTSRLTTVMQYASRDLARAFRLLGHDARTCIETNEMEQFDMVHYLRDYCNFNPHVTVNINHLNNKWLHPDVINVTWWQDDMPEIMPGKPLPWRENDYAYTNTARYVAIVEKTGISNVQFQPTPVDGDVFRLYPDVKREEKFVFVGSSYQDIAGSSNEAIQATATFCDLCARDIPIDLKTVQNISNQCGINETLGMWALNYAVKNRNLEYICQQTDIPVEVYGRGWETNPIIAPFFKGEVQHGEDLARIYCSAKYSMSCIGLENLTQRLAEIGACGCIPLVFDFRNCNKPPYWEEEVLYFRTREQLYECLKKSPPTYPDRFREYYNYNRFARQILSDVGLSNYIP